MGKFAPGDRFKVKDNGNTGYIVSYSTKFVGPWHSDTEYTVKWDHLSGTPSYQASDVDSLWEIVPHSINLTLPWGVHSIPISIPDPSSIKVECNGNHAWETYNGFDKAYDFCVNCKTRAPYLSGGKI